MARTKITYNEDVIAEMRDGRTATLKCKGKKMEDDVVVEAEYEYINFDGAVRSINHRGYSTVAPENTLPAYVLSKQHGFNYVEADVSFTSDGVAVLLHDSTIARTSNGSGSISSMTYEEVSQYDFGSWKSDDYANTKIPTFIEFIRLCKGIGLHPYIELKSNGAYTESQIRELVTIVDEFEMRGMVTWISFTLQYLEYIKSADPFARLGYLTGSVTEDVINQALGLKTDDNEVFIDSSDYDADAVSLCKNANLPLEIWTINSEYTIKSMDKYITGVTSDNIRVNAIPSVTTDALIDMDFDPETFGKNIGTGGDEYKAYYANTVDATITGSEYITVPSDFMAGTGHWTVVIRVTDPVPNTSVDYGRIFRGGKDVPSIYWNTSIRSYQAKLARASLNIKNDGVEVVNDNIVQIRDNGAVHFSIPSKGTSTFIFRNDGHHISFWIDGVEALRERTSNYTSGYYASILSIGNNEDEHEIKKYYYMDSFEVEMFRVWNRALSDTEIALINTTI